ncbi:hypothetical protein ACFL0U_01715 [Pseudomonadota bacterium]
MEQPQRELVLFQGEYAILTKEEFDSIYISGIDTGGNDLGGCTLLIIKALDSFGDKRSASHFLVAHLDHHNLALFKAREGLPPVSIGEEARSNIARMVTDFVKVSGAKYLHVVVHDGERVKTIPPPLSKCGRSHDFTGKTIGTRDQRRKDINKKIKTTTKRINS